MKYVLLLLAPLFLSACVSVPVERKFPSVPAELQQPCANLKTVAADTTKLSTVVESVVSNYGQYRECQIKNESWIEWYNSQKKIFDEVK